LWSQVVQHLGHQDSKLEFDSLSASEVVSEMMCNMIVLNNEKDET